jgi:hypothetical protein
MLAGFDHLSATEQNYLKYAAIMGSVFCLELLSIILKIDARTFRKSTYLRLDYACVKTINRSCTHIFVTNVRAFFSFQL